MKFIITDIKIEKSLKGSSASGTIIIDAGDRNSYARIVLPWTKDREEEFSLGDELEIK